MLSKIEKTLLKICSTIRNMIFCSDCGTVCWYLSSDFKKVVSKERQKEILNHLLSSVQNNELCFDNKFKLPVLNLSNPIKSNENIIEKLYFQNVITVDFIKKYLNETELEKNNVRYLSFMFNCSEDIIKNMNKKDYETACNLLSLLYIV